MPTPDFKMGRTASMAVKNIGFDAGTGKIRLSDDVLVSKSLTVKNDLTITGDLYVEGAGNVNGTLQKTSRYYLNEYFQQLPALNGNLTGSRVLDPAAIVDGDEESTDLTITGAALGDFAIPSFSIDTTDLTLTATVTAANTVTVVFANNTGTTVNLGSGTVRCVIIPQGGRDVKNTSFDISGTNMTSALCTRPTISSGIKLTTAGADTDQAILEPHLATGSSAWTGVPWGTEDEVVYEALIRTSAAIDNQKIWAGLKLTKDQLPQTDADQAYFYFATDGTNGQVLADYTKLYFIHSIAGTDYLTNTGITVAANTNYHLKISIDSNRKISIRINGQKYGVSTTAQGDPFDGTTEATGTSVTSVNQVSDALTNDVNLIPYIGIEAGDGAAAVLDVVCCAISRKIESPL